MCSITVDPHSATTAELVAWIAASAAELVVREAPESGQECAEDVLSLGRSLDLVEAAMAPRVARVDASGVFRGLGFPSVTAWLRSSLGMRHGRAAERVLLARQLPRLEHTAKLLGSAHLSAGHAAAICDAVQRLDDSDTAKAEDILLGMVADGCTVQQVGKAGDRIIDLIAERDGREAEPEDSKRGFKLSWWSKARSTCGGLFFKGWLMPEDAAAFEEVIGPLAKPKAKNDTRDLSERTAAAVMSVITGGNRGAGVTIVIDLDRYVHATGDIGPYPPGTTPADTPAPGATGHRRPAAPTGDPNTDPTRDPTGDPSDDLTRAPNTDPTQDPSGNPTRDPTGYPSGDPIRDLNTDPTRDANTDPTRDPSDDPTRDPSYDPTRDPTGDGSDDLPDVGAVGEVPAPDLSEVANPDLDGAVHGGAPCDDARRDDAQHDDAQHDDAQHDGTDPVSGGVDGMPFAEIADIAARPGDTCPGNHGASDPPTWPSDHGEPDPGDAGPCSADVDCVDAVGRTGTPRVAEPADTASAATGLGSEDHRDDRMPGPAGWVGGGTGLFRTAARLLNGTPITARRARQLALTGGISALILGSRGRPLYRGREVRFATTAQRKTLLALFDTCVVQGCPIPAHLCEIHHLDGGWKLGVPTDIDRLAPACGWHNRWLEDHPDHVIQTRDTRGRVSITISLQSTTSGRYTPRRDVAASGEPP
jgi:hypothetical protein